MPSVVSSKKKTASNAKTSKTLKNQMTKMEDPVESMLSSLDQFLIKNSLTGDALSSSALNKALLETLKLFYNSSKYLFQKGAAHFIFPNSMKI